MKEPTPFHNHHDAELNYVPLENLKRFEGPESITIHTVRRHIDSAALSKADIEVLNDLVDSFGKEKARILCLLGTRKLRRYCIEFESLREMLREEHDREHGIERGADGKKKRNMKPKSPYGLLDKLWKCAVEAACSTAKMYWRAQQVAVYKKLHRRKMFESLNACEKKICEALFSRLDARFFDFLDGEMVDVSNIEKEVKDGSKPRSLKKLLRFLLRLFRQKAGRFPVHKDHCSCVFGSDAYRLEKRPGSRSQIIYLTTKKRGKRLPVVLSGDCRIKGNVTLVRRNDGTFALHTTHDLRPKKRPIAVMVDRIFNGAAYTHAVGLDYGLTEVFYDDQGHAYGRGFSKLVMKKAERINGKLVSRSQLLQIALKTKNPIKRHNILRNNLGMKKWNEMRRREDAALENLVNRSINEIIATVPSGTIILEDLPETMEVPGHYSKKTKRLLTNWVRGIVKKRFEYKAAVFGLQLKYVPAAYTSQVCLNCSHVSRDNRHGNKFKCVACGAEGHADAKAALAILSVVKGEEFNRYTSWTKCRSIYRTRYEDWCKAHGLEALPPSVPQ